MSDNEQTTLYRAYNSDGVLLYVGIARNWGRRWEQHSERSTFFLATTRLELEHFPTRDAALAAERAAIKTERPIHNVKHGTPVTSMSGKGTTWTQLAHLEPRLLMLASEAAAIEDGGGTWFCAAREWYVAYPIGADLKARLVRLIGWERHRDLIPEPVGGTLHPSGSRSYTARQLVELEDPLDEYQESVRAAGDPAVLYSMEAYDCCYTHLLSLLPACRNCNCGI